MKKLISRFRDGDDLAFFSIYDCFEKQLESYAYKVNREDTLQDLRVHLLHIMHTINLNKFEDCNSDSIQRYIKVCLRHYYIKLSRERYSPDVPSEYIQRSTYDPISKIDMGDAIHTLSDKQQAVIMYKYILGYSDVEIAHILNISRQAVNRLKNRGIQTLANIYKL